MNDNNNRNGDKRKFLRLEVERLAICGQSATVEVVDLSPAGAGIVGDTKSVESIIGKMGTIRLEIPFKDDQIVVSGQIMWAQQSSDLTKAGVQFTSLSEEVKKKIRLYLYDRAIRDMFTTARLYGCE